MIIIPLVLFNFIFSIFTVVHLFTINPTIAQTCTGISLAFVVYLSYFLSNKNQSVYQFTFILSQLSFYIPLSAIGWSFVSFFTKNSQNLQFVDGFLSVFSITSVLLFIVYGWLSDKILKFFNITVTH